MKTKPMLQEETFARERAIREKGYRLIAGVDEAGRGPLAGPVVAAAIILPPDIDPPVLAGVRDSKQLSELAREQMYDLLTRKAYAFAAAQASAREIETLDIRKASLLAMKRAVEKLPSPPDYVLVDGRDYPDIALPGEAVVKGDRLCVSVGAASILAKVIRDRIMTALHKRYPAYGFDGHKGYPTEFHRAALQIFGACEQHRTTFSPVSDCLLAPEPSAVFSRRLQQIGECYALDAIQSLIDRLASDALLESERCYLKNRAQQRAEFLKRKERILHPASVDIGSDWEAFAAEHLQKQGFEIWERNYRGSRGEIDLVANKGTQIVFVEVKARTSAQYGMPYEAIGRKKREAIIRTAEEYLFKRDLLTGWDIRYDAASILAPKGETPRMDYFEDVFRVEEEFC